MNPGKRCILTVANGPEKYYGFQERLLLSLDHVRVQAAKHIWRGKWPPGPTHEEVPYGFKLSALRAAQADGYDVFLWLDTSVVAVAPLEALWREIENEGHYFIVGGDRLGNWTSEDALAEYHMTRDEVLAKNLQLIGGTVIGLDLRHVRTQAFMSMWEQAMQKGLFNGSYLNEGVEAPADKAGKPVGKVSNDPRCQGHRHDETIGSFLSAALGMKQSWIGGHGMVNGDPSSPHVILRSGY